MPEEEEMTKKTLSQTEAAHPERTNQERILAKNFDHFYDELEDHFFQPVFQYQPPKANDPCILGYN